MASHAIKGAPDGASVPERASLGDWLAVAAATLGALMATLDISIINSALPTIQGEIGASSTEGTWIATSYLVAEIVIIPMAAWLERLLGLRTFFLTMASLFMAFSILCGVSTNLMMMIIGRTGQGFTGGAMIPTAQGIIARHLPPRQQPIGIAAFGVTAIMGPVLGPLLGGWLTENVSWHYAFFINLPICLLLMVLLIIGLPPGKVKLDQLKQADWIGIAGLALGLGGLTVFLEDGQREQWFSSDLIRWMFVTMLVGLGLLCWSQMTARNPIVKLRLLRNRQLGAVVMMALVAGVVLYGTVYAIPQFLATLSGYNALQSGKVVLLAGLPSLVMLAMVPLLFRTFDIRVAIGMGMILMAVSALLDSHLTPQSDGGDFVASQLIRGVGQIFTMIFLSQAVVRSVAPEDAPDASGLFNAARNLGGSLALAGISILQDQRVYFHSRRLEETLNANSPAVQDYVAGLAAEVGDRTAGLRLLAQQIQAQALTMTYNDIFWIMAMATFAVMPLVFFLKPLPPQSGGATTAMH